MISGRARRAESLTWPNARAGTAAFLGKGLRRSGTSQIQLGDRFGDGTVNQGNSEDEKIEARYVSLGPRRRRPRFISIPKDKKFTRWEDNSSSPDEEDEQEYEETDAYLQHLSKE